MQTPFLVQIILFCILFCMLSVFSICQIDKGIISEHDAYAKSNSSVLP